MTKTQKLDLLFEKWQKVFPENQGKFKYDGIIDEDNFERQKVKLLFIGKEANDEQQNEGDYRSWWKEVVKYQFSIRLSEWAFGILNSFPPIESISESQDSRKEILSSIAFMNLKKTGGGNTADVNNLKEIVIRERAFILDEIEIIKPDIIIGSIGDVNLWQLIFRNDGFEESGYDVKIFRIKKMKIINFYHPSYRVPRAMSYSLLKNVYSSEKFNSL